MMMPASFSSIGTRNDNAISTRVSLAVSFSSETPYSREDWFLMRYCVHRAG